MSVSTHSLWSDAVSNRDGDPLTENVSCDICVVGSGIAGLTTAYLLAKAGKSVIVLEKNAEFASGETQYTSAHLSSIIDDGFSEIEKIRGTEFAKMAYESHAAAIDQIESIVADEKIACDFNRVSGYLFPEEGQDQKELLAEEEIVQRLGIPFHKHSIDPQRRFSGPCLEYPRQAEFHPLKYLQGLGKAFRAATGRIATGQTVVNIEAGESCRVTTSEGRVVTCRAVVVATNSPIHGGTLIHTKIAAYTSYVIAIELPPLAFKASLCWDTADPYHYVRLYHSPDHSARDVLIVGGEDHKTGQATDQSERWNRLEAWARIRFPDAADVRARWSGQIFETLDGLALIGPAPSGEKNVYVATGDSGMGLTHGTIAGRLLHDLVLSIENPWAELYSPKRLPLKAGGTYLSENLNMASQARDWVTSGDTQDESAVGIGQGAVIRRGPVKIAVYRDANNCLHENLAVCPHLGCLVRWNDGEATWDCPCHGSRFTGEGQLLHGPATKGLTPSNSGPAVACESAKHVVPNTLS